MATSVEAETTSDLRSLQRERRRLRDRQRRQDMSQEQRERHLARRRRNYQLRRLRAENSKLGSAPPLSPNLTPSASHENSLNLAVYSTVDQSEQIVEQSDSAIEGSGCIRSVSVGGGEGGMQRPKRLRMHQIRHLARLLHSNPPPAANDQTTAATMINANPLQNFSASAEGATKRLRLTHIKRLARALKSDASEEK